MCLTPLHLHEKKVSQYGNSVNIVACGKCPECNTQKRNGWAFRLLHEVQKSSSACMVTLTYREEPETEGGFATLRKSDFQKFLKRLRQQPEVKGLVYFASGEYGTKTKRPHYHAIMLNLPLKFTWDPKHIEKSWQHGHVHLAPCNIATINYTLKYLMKGGYQPFSDEEKQFTLMSKGIGKSFLTQSMKKHLRKTENNYVTLPSGVKCTMPRYYKEKVFSKHKLAKMGAKAKAQAIEKNEKRFPNEIIKIQYIKDQEEKFKIKQMQDDDKL